MKKMEITIDAKPTYTVRICDKCLKGQMKRIELAPYMEHRCTECGHKELYYESYPKFSYSYDPADIGKELEKLRKERNFDGIIMQLRL